MVSFGDKVAINFEAVFLGKSTAVQVPLLRHYAKFLSQDVFAFLIDKSPPVRHLKVSGSKV